MTSLSDKAKQEIREWQSRDGWWHGGEADYFKLAEELMSVGFSEDSAVNFLSGAYFTAANEFGG